MPVAIAGPLFSLLTAVGVEAGTAASLVNILAPALIFGAINVGISTTTGLIKGAGGKPVDPGRLVSFRESAAARRVIYGECRVGGIPTFLHTNPQHVFTYNKVNALLNIVYTLCGHEIDLLSTIYFDGKPLSFGNLGSDTNLIHYRPENGKFKGYAWAEWKYGKPGEPAFEGLTNFCASDTAGDHTNLWTADHRQDGCASVNVMMSWNADIYPSGPPAVTFRVRGKKLYDPRTGNTTFSRNAALAIYDFLTNKEYGLGADPAEINTASVIAAANVCDEEVTLKSGAVESRYEVNGMFAVDADLTGILNQLAAAMAGFIVYSQGQWYLLPGVWNAPTVHLTDNDLRAPSQFRTLTPKRDLCNAVRGIFYAQPRAYQKADFPPIVHPTHICDDSGFPNAVQKGDWTASTAYAVGDCAISQASRVLTGVWAPSILYHVNEYAQDTYAGVTSIYVCTTEHTSSSAGTGGNEPGRGATWQNYWADVTATYSEFRGGVYVCTVAHTSAALTEPGIGANWPSYWVEAKEYIWKDLELNFTTSSSMAQRIAKITLERTRRQTTGMLKCKLGALQFQPGDTFYYSHSRFGWTNKIFQVLQTDFSVESDGTVGVDLRVQEIDSAIFDWDEDIEEQALGEPSEPILPESDMPRNQPAAYGNGLTWTAYTDHVVFDWDYSGDNAIILLDQDNTRYEPVGSQDVTGLTSNHAYKFFPYCDRNVRVPTFIASIAAVEVYFYGRIYYPYVYLTRALTSGELTDIVGQNVYFTGLTAATFLNGKTFEITSAGNDGPDGTGKLHLVSGWIRIRYVKTDDTGTAQYGDSLGAFSGLLSNGVGTPAWLLDSTDGNTIRAALAETNGNGRIGLSVRAVDVSTTSSGSTPGSGGGGGGGGGCLQLGMLVKEKTRGVICCEDVQVGDILWSDDPDGMVVEQVGRRQHDLWVTVRFSNGAEVIVTASHPFTLANGGHCRAARLSLEDAVPSPTGIAYPVSIHFEREQWDKIPITGSKRHTFYASSDGKNWILTHNINYT